MTFFCFKIHVTGVTVRTKEQMVPLKSLLGEVQRE